jgi:tetratricopeptide (TPR) repeat protein
MRIPASLPSLRWLKLVAAALLALWLLSRTLPAGAQSAGAPAADSAVRIQELKDAIAKDPSDPEPHTQLGILYANERLYDDARTEFIAAVQASPNEPASHMNLGLVLLRMEAWTEAQSILQNYVRMTATKADGHLRHGDAFAGAGDLDRAREIWIDGSSTKGMAMGDRMQLIQRAAESFLEEEKFAETQELLAREPALLDEAGGKALQELASYSSVQLAKAAKENGDKDEALKHYGRARAANPNDAGAYAEAMEILLEQARFTDADELLKDAEAALVGDATPHFLAGRVAESQGDFQSAVSHYRRAESRSREYPGLYARLGGVLAAAGDAAGASEAFEEAVKRGQGGSAASYNMGVVLSQKGQYAEAIPHLLKAVEADSRHKDAYRALGQAYRKTNDFTRMTNVYQDINDTFGPDSRDLYQLAYAQAKLDRHRDAVGNYEMVVALEPDNFAARYNLGNSLLKIEEFAEAVGHFEGALMLKPDEELARYNLALCQQKMGKFEAAIQNYELALELKESYRSYVNMAICYQKLEDQESSDYFYGKADEMKKKGRG